MLNILKMDLYRIIKSKYSWFVLITLCIFTWLAFTDRVGMIEMSKEARAAGDNSYVYAESSLVDFKFTSEAYSGLEPITAADLLAAPLWGRMFSMIISVFYVLFIYSEMSSGYIKNIAGRVRRRGTLILSKQICLLLYTAICMACVFAVTMLFAAGKLGYVPAINVMDLLKIASTHFILQAANGTVILFIVTLSRNAIVSMPAALFLGSNMLCSMLRMLPAEHPILNFSIFGNIDKVANGSNPQAFAAACAVSLIYIVIGTILCIGFIEKRDITT